MSAMSAGQRHGATGLGDGAAVLDDAAELDDREVAGRAGRRRLIGLPGGREAAAGCEAAGCEAAGCEAAGREAAGRRVAAVAGSQVVAAREVRPRSRLEHEMRRHRPLARELRVHAALAGELRARGSLAPGSLAPGSRERGLASGVPGTRGLVRGRPGHRVRLTRRGRAVVGFLAGIAVAVVAALWLASATGAQAANHGVPPGTVYKGMTSVVVKPGQTLWSIALRAEPTADPRVVISRIMQFNAMSSDVVVPGERLWVPAS
jgi:nucleoid-associated protein YgaU